MGTFYDEQVAWLREAVVAKEPADTIRQHFDALAKDCYDEIWSQQSKEPYRIEVPQEEPESPSTAPYVRMVDLMLVAYDAPEEVGLLSSAATDAMPISSQEPRSFCELAVLFLRVGCVILDTDFADTRLFSPCLGAAGV